MALDPEITTLEPQLEMETQAPTGIPATDEFHFIDEQAFFSSESTTSETTAATTTLYNNDGSKNWNSESFLIPIFLSVVGLKFAGGGKGGKKSKKSKKAQKKNPQKENAVENIMKIHGDEAAPRKDHKCGNIPLPEIKVLNLWNTLIKKALSAIIVNKVTRDIEDLAEDQRKQRVFLNAE